MTPDQPATTCATMGAILDVDGVLLASPHDRAWREALQGLAEPKQFTTAMYQSCVAGKPTRLAVLYYPDKGGTTEQMVRINKAYEEARKARSGNGARRY